MIFVIDDSIENIGEYAFHGCCGLTGIIIPSSVTEIGQDVFEGCLFKSVIFESTSMIFLYLFHGNVYIKEIIFTNDISGVQFESGSLDTIEKVYLNENQLKGKQNC